MTTDARSQSPTIAVVIPCYRVGRAVLDVIKKIGPEVHTIYCVDDCCPDGTAELISREATDPRVRVLKHTSNKGVGGAMRTGYRAALADERDIIVKIDGDGQMEPALLPLLVAPILRGDADYTKGNRFFSIDRVRGMPTVRLIGNAVLSFAAKLSTGYWSLFDPTNGYTAIHSAVLAEFSLDQVSERYFFETDMLFRLNVLRAKVVDIPMIAVYGNEKSNLAIRKIILPFAAGHLRNLFKRIVYNYFLRDFQIASVELALGTVALSFGTIFGFYLWVGNGWRGVYTQAGPVMLAALPVMTGIQLLLAFLSFDIHAEPSRAIHSALRAQRNFAGAKEQGFAENQEHSDRP